MSIPNTLTIYLNTRIRGQAKLKYKPSMTVPGVRSDTVYFNPIIKLSKNAINSIPRGYPESEVYTQFFDENAFQSLVNRSITNISQARVPIDEATKKGIVDNNIELIINTLFKKNTKFYMHGKPYTIYSHDWIRGDWQIDKKKLETYMLQQAYGPRGYGYYNAMATQDKMAENELNELKKIDNGVAIKGFAVTSPDLTSKIKEEFELTSGLGLRAAATSVPTSRIQPTTMTPEQQDALKKQQKENIPKVARNFVTNKFTNQSVVNLEDGASLSSDPISLTILYTIDRDYTTDINENKQLLEPLYNQLLEQGINYKNAKEKYDIALGTYQINDIKSIIQTPVEISKGTTATPPGSGPGPTPTPTPTPDNLFKDKKKYDGAVEELYKMIKYYKEKKNISYEGLMTAQSLQNQKKTILYIITSLETYKKKFLKKFLQTLGLLINKNKVLNNYINALTKFYLQLYLIKEKSFKLNHVENKPENILTLNIIKFDVQCYKTILYNFTPASNKSLSVSLQNLMQTYKHVESYIKTMDATPVNYQEIFKNYYNHPKLLKFNKYQLDIYMFTVLKYDQMIELILWKILYRQTDIYLNTIKDSIIGKQTDTGFIEGKIDIARTMLTQYNQKYTQQERDAFLQNAMQLNKPLQQQSSAITDFIFPSSKNTALKQQQNDYIHLQTAVMLCYDLITLYAKVSAIKYSREISLVTCKKNVDYAQLEINQRVIDSDLLVLKDRDMIPFIPENLVGEKEPYNDEELLKSSILEKTRFKIKFEKLDRTGYSGVLTLLENKYNNAIETIIPHISKLGILNKCQQIVENDVTDDKINNIITDYNYDDKTPLTKGQAIVNVFQKEKNEYYDSYLTTLLQSNISLWYSSGVRDRIIPRMTYETVERLAQQWIVIDNYGSGNGVFFAIASIFNNYLVTNGKKSDNPFADVSAGGYYTAQSLRFAFADPNYGLGSDIIQRLDNDRKPELDSLLSKNKKDLTKEDKRKLKLWSFLYDENRVWIGDDENAVRNAIRYSSEYSGNITAITIIERIFKIKFIIIDTSYPTDESFIPIGTMVYFLINKTQKKYGYITAYNQEKDLYTIIDTYYIIYDNISRRRNKIQILSDYFCITNTRLLVDEARQYTHFAFLLKTSILNEFDNTIDHWEYMYNVVDNKFIYSFDEIPDCLKYFIFEKSWRFLTPQERVGSWLNRSVFSQYLNDCQRKIDEIAARAHRDVVQVGGDNTTVNTTIQTGETRSFRPGFRNNSNLSYYIIVDLELYPGESIPLLKQPVIACHIRYEKIRQAFAEMFGLLYRPLEFNQSGHVSLSSVEYDLKKRNEEKAKEKEQREEKEKEWDPRRDRGYYRYQDQDRGMYTRNYRPYYGGNKNATRRIKIHSDA
jgi:hypothetical protein